MSSLKQAFRVISMMQCRRWPAPIQTGEALKARRPRSCARRSSRSIQYPDSVTVLSESPVLVPEATLAPGEPPVVTPGQPSPDVKPTPDAKRGVDASTKAIDHFLKTTPLRTGQQVKAEAFPDGDAWTVRVYFVPPTPEGGRTFRVSASGEVTSE